MDEESKKRTISSSVSATNFVVYYSINNASTPSPLEKAFVAFANFLSMVIPSEVEESPYKQICTNGDFSIPLPLVAPLEMTIIDYFYNFFVTLLESTNQSTPRALPTLEMTA